MGKRVVSFLVWSCLLVATVSVAISGQYVHPFNVSLPKNDVIIVEGDVRAPQRLTWRPGLTLAEALSQCGGVGSFVKSKAVLTITCDKRQLRISLKALYAGDSFNPLLMPGDIIRVPE